MIGPISQLHLEKNYNKALIALTSFNRSILFCHNQLLLPTNKMTNDLNSPEDEFFSEALPKKESEH